MANALVGAGWAALQLPLQNRGTLQLNGRTAGRHTIGLYGSGAELLRANRQSSTHAALFLPAHAAEPLLCPARGLPITRPGHSGLFDTKLPAWSRLAGLVGHLGQCDDAAREDLEPVAAREGLRASLLEIAREVLAGAEPGVPARTQRACRGWTRIVRGAEALLRADPARPIYTEELCASLGVSAASLAEAFRQVLGITPHRYLKRRRLAMVRAALRVPDGPPPLVKSVALSHGFWHLGQFAIDYRDLYGEAPSATLARCRGWLEGGAAAGGDGWRMAG
ncbi:MAG: helix-turn-helix domain-containing protein [Acetobacteraceae bacterium]|nr:helix-turn-helix domain-containing protein [Acetobacteraceae bacterium]